MKFLATTPLRFIAAGTLLFSLLANNATAVVTWWDPTGTTVTAAPSDTFEGNKWSTTAAPTASPVAFVDNTAIGFTAGTSGSQPFTVTMNANHNFAGVFNNGATAGTTAGSVIITGSGILTLAGGAQGFSSQSSTNNTEFKVPIAGTGIVQNQGSGSLYLYGANTFTGGVQLNTGAGLNFNNNSSFGTGPISTLVSLAVLATPAVDFTGVTGSGATGPITIANNVSTFNGTGTFIIVGNAVAPLTWTGNWALGGTSANTTTLDTRSGTLTISGVISGAANLTKATATGTLILSGNNTYTGNSTINSGVFLTIGGAGTLGSGSYAGNIANAGTFAYNSSAAQTFSGILSGAGTNYQSGPGTLTLSGVNTYTGPITNSGGILKVGNNSAIASGSGKGNVGIGASGTLDLAGFTVNVNGLFGSGTVDNSTGNGSLTMGNNNAGGNFSGVIKNTAGVVTVTKSGAGTFTLGGANTYSGKTFVTGGTLNISSDGNLGAVPGSYVSDQVTINGGTLQFTATAVDVAANRGITIGASGGTISASSSQSPSIESIISGTGVLTKSSSGNVNLNAANTFSAGFTITGGGVRFNNNQAAGTGTITVTPASIVTLRQLNPPGPTSVTIPNPINLNANAGNDIDLACATGNIFTLSGNISGVGYLTRDRGTSGNGVVGLSGSNSAWSGGLLWRGSGISLGSSNALGTGTLSFTPNIAADPIFLSATTALTGASAVTNVVQFAVSNATQQVNIGGANDLELSGPISLGQVGSVSPVIITNKNAGATILSGPISGAGFGLTFSGTGTLTLNGNNTYNGGTTVAAGKLLVSNSAGSGTGSGTVTVLTGATLGGGGDIAGTVTVNNGGTLSPGASIGTLTLDIPPVLNGTTSMEIDRNGGSPLSDKLVVSSGTLTYSGTLNIVNLGAPLQNGDTFTLFNAGTYAGSFSSITPATPGAGLVWDTSGLTVNGTIKAICNGTLAASAGANTNICTGSGALIGGSPTATGGSGTGYTYSWSPATGLNDATLANPTATPASTTTYTVTVTDSVGCTAMASVTVGVDVAPAITGQPANTTVCSGSSASFSVAATGSGLNYSWSKHSNSGWGSAWTIGASGGGTFLASSTGNNSGDPNCNGFNAGGDINTSGGNSFGLYGGSGGESVSRDFPNALTSGQSFSIDMDNGNVDVGQQNGFALQTSGGTFLLSFYFLGGSDYKFYDTSEHDTGIAFTRTGLRIQLIVNSGSTYKLVVTPCGGSASVFFGTFANAGDAGKLVLFNNNGSGGGANDLFFNNIIAGGAVDNADNYSSGYVGQDMGDQAIVASNGSSTYTTPALTTGDSGTQYAVVVSGCSGTVLSSAATVTVNPPATVSAGPNQTVCASSPAVTLAGSLGGAASSATWSGGTGSFNPNNTTTNATYTPTAGEITAGTVTLTLTTDDPSGPCGPVNSSMTITINPAATVSAGPNQTVCASSPAVTLAGSFGGAASTATWSGGAGSFNPNNTTTNAIYTPTAGEITAGTVTLTLTTDDPTGLCGPVTASMAITINPAATVNAGPNQTVCGDNPAAILAGAIGGGASSATWSGGAGSFIPNNTTTNATYTPTAGEITAGSVTLTLTTDDPTGPCGAVNASIVITFDKVTATNLTFVRNAGVSLKISKTNLVANASDTDSETISVVGAGTDGVNLLTTNGATLSMDADWIYYTNSVTPDVNDSFLYKVTDSRGCVGVATVFVQVVQNETGQGTTVTVSNGVATVGFAGIPGRSYQVQRSTNLTDWVTLVTTNAPANGVFEWADDFNDLGVPPADPPSSAYYRLRVP